MAHFYQKPRALKKPARSLLLVEALIAVGVVAVLLASIGAYFQQAQRAKGLAEQSCAQALARAELSFQLDQVFQAVLTPHLQQGEICSSLCDFCTDELGSKLSFTYKPPFEKMWSLGAVAKGTLRRDDGGQLLLESTPFDVERSEGRFQNQTSLLATGARSLRFQFLHIGKGAPLAQLALQRGAVSPSSHTATLERCTWPKYLGFLPTMLKVRLEFESGAVWESAHFLQTSTSLLYS